MTTGRKRATVPNGHLEHRHGIGARGWLILRSLTENLGAFTEQAHNWLGAIILRQSHAALHRYDCRSQRVMVLYG